MNYMKEWIVIKFIVYFILAYLFITILVYFYRKSLFFRYWTLPKYNYLLLLDMDLLVLMLKNHVKNDQGNVIGFQDLQGNVLSATKVNDLFHQNNVSLNLGFFMKSKDIPNEFVYLTGVIHFLFDAISNLHKEDDLYKKLYDDINKIYCVVRDLNIRYQTHFFKTHQNKLLVDFKQYNEPKTLKQLHVIKFLTI